MHAFITLDLVVIGICLTAMFMLLSSIVLYYVLKIKLSFSFTIESKVRSWTLTIDLGDSAKSGFPIRISIEKTFFLNGRI